MSMTTTDIEPSLLVQMREGSEPVIAKTERGYQRGVRSKGLWTLGCCLGRMTITEEGEVYHSMLGSVPVWTVTELAIDIAKEQGALDLKREALAQLS